MPQKFDTAARGAVLLGGRDLTRHTKRFSSTENIPALDDTHMQPEGDAMNYLAGLSTSAISISGSLPMSKALVEIEMRKALGLNRDPEPLLLAPWGLNPGYYAEFLQTEQSRFGTEGMTPNITSYNADFVGSGGVFRGTMLQSSQGAGTVTQNEIKTLTFTNADPNQFYGIRVAGTTEVFAITTATTNAQYKTGLEALSALAGRTITVTGAALIGSTTKSGDKTFEFSGLNVVPAFEIVSGAVRRRQIINGGTGNYSFDGSTPRVLPITQAQFDTDQKAIGAAHAGSVSIGSSMAASNGAQVPGYRFSGAANTTFNGDYITPEANVNGKEAWSYGVGVAKRWLFYHLGAQGYAFHFNTTDTNPTYYRPGGGDLILGGSGNWIGVGAESADCSYAYALVPSSLDFTTYFPVSAAPGAATKTGTGATNTTLAAAGSIATTISSATTQPGGTFAGNMVNAAFNGPWIDLQSLTGDATTNDGGAAIIEVPYASTNCNATVRIQHADDAGGNTPGAATTLAAFDVVTKPGAQFISIPRGTQCKRFVRVSITSGQITGSLALAAAFCRNSPVAA